MTESMSPQDASAMPGAPHENLFSQANEGSREPHVSTGATAPRGYIIRQSACYNYNDYNYNGYNYNSGSGYIGAPARKTTVVSAGIPQDLFLKLESREQLTGKSRSEIIKEALTLYLQNDVPVAAPQRPSLAVQMKTEKSRKELAELYNSLFTLLIRIRDGDCASDYPKAWHLRFEKRLISAIQQLELSEEEERLAQVMSAVAKEASKLNPLNEGTYEASKKLLTKLQEVEAALSILKSIREGKA